MRNDARPIGESTGHDRSPIRDHADSTDDWSPTQDVDDTARRRPSHPVDHVVDDERVDEDEKQDPVMPSRDSTLRTEI
jgi:hypothetical protein